MNDNQRADTQYDVLNILQQYWHILKAMFYTVPWIVIAYYCFLQFLNNAPEPEWWIQLERQLMRLLGL